MPVRQPLWEFGVMELFDGRPKKVGEDLVRRLLHIQHGSRVGIAGREYEWSMGQASISFAKTEREKYLGR